MLTLIESVATVTTLKVPNLIHHSYNIEGAKPHSPQLQH